MEQLAEEVDEAEGDQFNLFGDALEGINDELPPEEPPRVLKKRSIAEVVKELQDESDGDSNQPFDEEV